ncbi:MAG: hypothetical protein NWQ21_06575, partial [Desulfobacterales bacterium]|nr:hypothetical protein [Desulfobacterales bacterium]
LSQIYENIKKDFSTTLFWTLQVKVIKGSLKNNFTFWKPMHSGQLRCENSEYPDIPAFSRLTGRAAQRPKL